MSMFVRDCAPPAGKDRKKDPMVFIHGVGFGVLPYVHFLGRMLANTDRPWIVVEMRHVSMRLSIRHRSVSLQTLANDIVDQMQAIGYEKGLWCVELRTPLSPTILSLARGARLQVVALVRHVRHGEDPSAAPEGCRVALPD